MNVGTVFAEQIGFMGDDVGVTARARDAHDAKVADNLFNLERERWESEVLERDGGVRG